MSSMSGAAFSPAPRDPASGPVASRDDETLFATTLVGSGNRQSRRGWVGAQVSLAAHVVVAAALLLVPVLLPDTLPDRGDPIRVLIYDPPPPPPPPLNIGTSSAPMKEVAKPATTELEVKKEEPKFQAPVEHPPQEVKPLEPDAKVAATEQFGSETGSEFGVPEGDPAGVEGGVVGGTVGGVIGGVLGGTGTGPVMDYDQPPRPIKLTKPVYPTEAFVKKIEGTPVVEILIDTEGRVIRARIIQSVPMLDAAAIETVKQWRFMPAIKGGRPVPTIATAPVRFQIF
jgi:protein TonB